MFVQNLIDFRVRLDSIFRFWMLEEDFLVQQARISILKGQVNAVQDRSMVSKDG